MFSNELRPDETLAGALDAMIAHLIEEHRKQNEKEKQDYDAALTAAKPLFDILAVLGPWLSEQEGNEGLVEFQIQTRVNGKHFDVTLEWNMAIEQWLVQFPGTTCIPGTTRISARALETHHLRYLANVNFDMLARWVATMAIELGVNPPRFTPQDAPHEDQG